MIPLDINTVKMPREVLLCTISRQIKYECESWNTKIPEELKPWVETHKPDDADDWYERLMNQSTTMLTKLLEKWIEVMPSSLYRAEMRGELLNRPDWNPTL